MEGRFPKHRGHYLGRVVAVRGDDVEVARDDEGRPWTGVVLPSRDAPRGELASPLPGRLRCPAARIARAGMGVVFDEGEPESQEPGGAIWRVESTRRGWVLGFGSRGLDLERVARGQRVWLTSDPAVQVATGEPEGRVPSCSCASRAMRANRCA